MLAEGYTVESRAAARAARWVSLPLAISEVIGFRAVVSARPGCLATAGASRQGGPRRPLVRDRRARAVGLAGAHQAQGGASSCDAEEQGECTTDGKKRGVVDPAEHRTKLLAPDRQRFVDHHR